MKKFILKTTLFLAPIVLLFLITFTFYSDSESPDLIRLGYFPNIYKDYRNVFSKDLSREIYFYKLSNTKIKKAKILTIGDSFSQQGNYGYNNYLAEKYSVLNLDRFLSRNSVQTLYELLNGDFFSTYKIEYVVLESVERDFISSVQNIDVSKKITNIQLDSIIKSQKKILDENYRYNFFSSTTIKFPFSMLQYYLDKNYLSNKMVYNVTLKTNNLFSNNSDKLLFYGDDLWKLKKNNDLREVLKLNNILNDLTVKLKSKNVKLIVLPAPDKYDLYYSYIMDKTELEEPMFFKYLESVKKDYLFINSKKLLSHQLESEKDIYFYDDTHWSPVASKIIACEIKSVIIKE
ncbi:alginate O-acetyltransferase AlgX-related protein [Flavobacterium sp.]|uniref:alginate O-acetyltransferase AlgX-related protein n=1 Tax=Flavobacterium sp. TaxID=239 RepID=UPI002ED7F203